MEIKIGRPMFGKEGDLDFTADLWFRQNGSTGIQKVKGDNLQDVVNKINAFLEGL